MTVHPDQDDQKSNDSRITCRALIQLPLDIDGIYFSIDTQMMEKPHIILVHLIDLDNGRQPDIGTLKEGRGDISFECCTEIFKEHFCGMSMKYCLK